MTYKVREPFLAVSDEPPAPFVFVTLQPGVMITVKGEVLKSGLVDVQYNGQIVGAFMRDIVAHAEAVDGVSAG